MYISEGKPPGISDQMLFRLIKYVFLHSLERDSSAQQKWTAGA